MTSVWRQGRLRADDLLKKIQGGESQTIASEFWEAPGGEPPPITGTISETQQPQTQVGAGLFVAPGVGQGEEFDGLGGGGEAGGGTLGEVEKAEKGMKV